MPTPLGGDGNAPVGPTTEEQVLATAEALSQVEPSAPKATAPAPSPQPARPATGVFRQPSFRSGTRAAGVTTRTDAAPSAGGRRPLPYSPYQGRDLRTIAVLTVVLFVALVAFKIVL